MLNRMRATVHPQAGKLIQRSISRVIQRYGVSLHRDALLFRMLATLSLIASSRLAA